MRLDGELVRDDGAGVNWRELHTGARELLIKTTDGVALLDANLFLSNGTVLHPSEGAIDTTLCDLGSLSERSVHAW
jgi:hypothetical protein